MDELHELAVKAARRILGEDGATASAELDSDALSDMVELAKEFLREEDLYRNRVSYSRN